MGLLDDIVRSKHREALALRESPVAPTDRAALDVPRALRRTSGAPLRLVAEVKLKSPSAGPLSRALSPSDRAVAYAEGGAAMVSVLCDGPYFDGGWAHLSAARAAFDARGLAVPLLAKEFVVDEAQIAMARASGGDAVLLIARIVEPARLSALAAAARAAGIEPLVEIVDERELDAAVDAGARIIGVNARDLDTLAMDAGRAAKLVARVPREAVAVYLSGVRGAADVARIAAGRSDAALIGEVLMRADDPRPLLRELVAAGG